MLWLSLCLIHVHANSVNILAKLTVSSSVVSIKIRRLTMLNLTRAIHPCCSEIFNTSCYIDRTLIYLDVKQSVLLFNSTANLVLNTSFWLGISSTWKVIKATNMRVWRVSVLKNRREPIRDRANYHPSFYVNPTICQRHPVIVYWLSIMNGLLQPKMCVLIRELLYNYIYIIIMTLMKRLSGCPSLFTKMIIFNYDVWTLQIWASRVVLCLFVTHARARRHGHARILAFFFRCTRIPRTRVLACAIGSF